MCTDTQKLSPTLPMFCTAIGSISIATPNLIAKPALTSCLSVLVFDRTKKQPELNFWTENWAEKLAARETDTETGVDSKDVVRLSLDSNTTTEPPSRSDSGSDIQRCDTEVTIKNEGDMAEVKTEGDAHECGEVEGGKKGAKTNGEIETVPLQTNSIETGVGVKLGGSGISGVAPVLGQQPSRAVVAGSGNGVGAEVNVKVSPLRYEGHPRVI